MILLAAPPTDILLVFSHESVILRREEHILELVATVVIFAGSVRAGERFKRPSPRSYSSKPLEARPDLYNTSDKAATTKTAKSLTDFMQFFVIYYIYL